jgi:hypothetical protein
MDKGVCAVSAVSAVSAVRLAEIAVAVEIDAAIAHQGRTQ